MADRCKCGLCRRACADYERARYNARALGRFEAQRVDPTGAVRRLRALAWMGWSSADLAPLTGIQSEHLGRIRAGRKTWIRPATHAAIARAYDELWDQQPPIRSGKAKSAPLRARLHARRRGWLSPLAWDDIDTDPGPAVSDVAVDVDEIAVDLACSGQPVALTQPERIEAVRRLHAWGLSDPQVAERLRIQTAAVFKIRSRHLNDTPLRKAS